MNSPLALVIAAAGGLCLLVGGWYLTATTREPKRSQSSAVRLFGVACLVIAGQEYAALPSLPTYVRHGARKELE